ncbi:MAG: hypothetical protein AB1648_09220 [Pseudomonadota bacterium]
MAAPYFSSLIPSISAGFSSVASAVVVNVAVAVGGALISALGGELVPYGRRDDD